MLCSRLRGLAQDCIDKHLNLSAIFYADKLVTFSNGAPGDVYLLAQVRGALDGPQLSLPRSAVCLFQAFPRACACFMAI